MKNKTNVLLFGSVGLILLAVVLVGILDKMPPAGPSADLRIQAGTQNVLKFTGVVNTSDQGKGTVEVTNLQFADTNRAGNPQNLGDWTVTAPAGFNFVSVSPGTTVTIGVDASTFIVTSHSLTAVTLSAGN